MAIKGKPDLEGMLSENIKAFANGANVKSITPAASYSVPIEEGGNELLPPPAPRTSVKRQVALRLDDETIVALTKLAGDLTSKYGSKISLQDLMEAAIKRVLKPE